MGTASKAARDWLRSCDGEEQGLDQTFVLNLLRRTRTTGFRSTGLMNLSKHILRAVRASCADVSGAFSVLCRDRACTASSSNPFVAEFRVYRTRSTEERPKSRAVVSGIQTWEPNGRRRSQPGGPRAEHDAGPGAPAAGGGDSLATPGSNSGGFKHGSGQRSVFAKNEQVASF